MVRSQAAGLDELTARRTGRLRRRPRTRPPGPPGRPRRSAGPAPRPQPIPRPPAPRPSSGRASKPRTRASHHVLPPSPQTRGSAPSACSGATQTGGVPAVGAGVASLTAPSRPTSSPGCRRGGTAGSRSGPAAWCPRQADSAALALGSPSPPGEHGPVTRSHDCPALGSRAGARRELPYAERVDGDRGGPLPMLPRERSRLRLMAVTIETLVYPWSGLGWRCRLRLLQVWCGGLRGPARRRG